MPATAAQIDAARNNAKKSTGPRTPEGKSKASRNAVKLGLFSARDFVLPQDQLAYRELHDAFRHDLRPEGPVEETLTLEIIRASWRLERCAKAEAAYADRIVEAALLGNYAIAETQDSPGEVIYTRVAYTPEDPLQNEAGQRFQAAIDRARAGANNTFRRALADLRRIQAQRDTARQQPADEDLTEQDAPEQNTPAQNTIAAPAPAQARTQTRPLPGHPAPARPECDELTKRTAAASEPVPLKASLTRAA